ncbi:hypothetical protein [Actinophytocola sp. NPDC049390]|uniref:hypothetical protein n=1 Tax=Actinophytocola sp. NPDC049390 TaxID=3363894 RepID=UPI00379EC824
MIRRVSAALVTLLAAGVVSVTSAGTASAAPSPQVFEYADGAPGVGGSDGESGVDGAPTVTYAVTAPNTRPVTLHEVSTMDCLPAILTPGESTTCRTTLDATDTVTAQVTAPVTPVPQGGPA